MQKRYPFVLSTCNGRSLTYDYDSAGRFIEQVLPDGRATRTDRDAVGDVRVMHPPGRPAHTLFLRTLLGRESK